MNFGSIRTLNKTPLVVSHVSTTRLQLLVGALLGGPDGDVDVVRTELTVCLLIPLLHQLRRWVIGLVFIIIKLMQDVINKKGSSSSYCP
jgi:hypothetical protein